jgi:hypothetical protein
MWVENLLSWHLISFHLSHIHPHSFARNKVIQLSFTTIIHFLFTFEQNENIQADSLCIKWISVSYLGFLFLSAWNLRKEFLVKTLEYILLFLTKIILFLYIFLDHFIFIFWGDIHYFDNLFVPFYFIQNFIFIIIYFSVSIPWLIKH